MTFKHNIKIAEPDITNLETGYVMKALKNNELSYMGSYVNDFENKFANFCEVSHASACMNGTVALHLALIGANVSHGDEVIVPALTYVSTANAVVHAGAKPVFADVHANHWGINPEEVIKKITPNTKAIIAVHLYGHPADMDPLLKICKEKKITLIEDAAEAHGARYKGKRVGSIGDIGTFSFFANKIMTTGEGGMITCDDQETIDRIKVYTNHGNDPHKRYHHQVIGYNYRMTNLQAAIGCAQIERANELLKKKKDIATQYREGLQNLPLSMQPFMEWADPVNWMNCLVLGDTAISRSDLEDGLNKCGIDTRPFFVPIPNLEIYNDPESYPVAESLSSRGINIPSSTLLEKKEIDYIIQSIKNLF